MNKPPKTKNVGRNYTMGILLATGLFIFHTWVIFETAFILSISVGPAIKLAGLHLAGPLLILGCFFVLFAIHLLEAAAWAFYFWKLGEVESFPEAIYFAGTSLTALGYGDIVLRSPWRTMGPIMAINGILMFGCSTAFLFFVIQKIWAET